VVILNPIGKSIFSLKLLTDVTHSLICEDREKVKGKGEKGLLIYFHNLLKLSISRCFA
jgi:hypothetical protein